MLGSLMRLHSLPGACLAGPVSALGAPALHDFATVAIAPDGRHIASIETQDDGSDRDAPASLLIRDLKGGAMTVPLPCSAGPNCKVDSPAWSRSGELAFIVSRPDDGGAGLDAL